MQTSPSLETVAEKGRAIYQREIRPRLQEADKGKFLFIHTETGEWVIDADDQQALRNAVERFGYNQPLFFMRAGFRSATAFRPGLDLELSPW